MINYDSLLSDQVKRMQPSGIRKFFDVAAMMEGVISLGVGEPDFQTPWVVRKEAVDILERKRIIYSANSGMMNLRKEIANYLNRKYDLTYDPDSEVIATVGGSEAIDLAIRAIVNPGDEVLVVEPSFVCYKPIVELMHGVAVPIPTKEENKFKLTPEELRSHITERTKMLILPYPNNPTGAVYTREQLAQWVAYARKNDAILLFDAAYECFVTDPALPRSIFEIEGAKECAIEFCSFSKIAGFTGTRCGYTVVPMAIEREGMSPNKMWLRRQTTKFNGVPYIVQRGAAAVFTEDGMAEIQHNLDYYRANAKVIAGALDECDVWYCGGKNSPYIWMKCPGGMDSWTFFDWLLETTGVVGTPGVGFGSCGEGFFRLTAFGNAEKTKIAAERVKNAILSLNK